MKHKLSLVALTIVLLASACVKDGDFDELKHPLRLHGEFDPTYGFPVAWVDADLGTLLGFVPTGGKLSVVADPVSGLLTILADSTMHTSYAFQDKKAPAKTGTKDGAGTVLYRDAIEHGNKIELGDYLPANDIVLSNLYVSFGANARTVLSDELQRAIIDRGVEVQFDAIKVTIDCDDGRSYPVTLAWDQNIKVDELRDGKYINIVDKYDISRFINNRAKRVHFETALKVVATKDGPNIDEAYIKDSLYIDSLIVDYDAYVEYAAVLYVGNLRERDTLQADLSVLEKLLEEYGNDSLTVSLNEDSNHYLCISADNGLPYNIEVQLSGLDSNMMPTTGGLLPDETFLVAAPVEEVPDSYSQGWYEGYMASGRTHSDIRVPLTSDLVRKLAKSTHLDLNLHVTSTTEGTQGEKPFVILRDVDKLKLKVYLRLSPHITINFPFELPTYSYE